jgi:hypothetical protein
MVIIRHACYAPVSVDGVWATVETCLTPRPAVFDRPQGMHRSINQEVQGARLVALKQSAAAGVWTEDKIGVDRRLTHRVSPTDISRIVQPPQVAIANSFIIKSTA